MCDDQVDLADPLEHDAVNRRRLLAGAAATGVALAAGQRLRAQANAASTLTCQMQVPVISDPRLFDQSEMANLVRGTLENLVRYTDDLQLVPWLLSGWDVTADARTITLRLREGVRWSNGDAFTAEDVVYNFRRWCDRSVPGNSMADRMSALVDPAAGTLTAGTVVAADTQTVVLNLQRPDVTLIPSLSDYPALIVHRSFDAEGADITNAPIGTGPYLLEAYQPGASAMLSRRDNWWGGEVDVERIVYADLGLDPTAYRAAFSAGEIDMVYGSTGPFVDIFDAQNLVREEVLSGSTIVFRVNRSAVPEDHPYRDARVRRALTLAVDNGVILELGYANLGAIAENHHVGPMNPDFVGLGAPKPDPEAAMRLMREAGADRMEHELISIDDDWNRASADAVAAQLRDAGMQVTRRILTAAQYWSDWRTHPFSCTAWNMRPLGLQVLQLAYASDGVWNETGFASETFDALLAQALAETDADARAPMMRAMAQLLVEDGTIIQPYWRSLILHHNVRVTGVTRHPTNEHHHDLWGLLG